MITSVLCNALYSCWSTLPPHLILLHKGRGFRGGGIEDRCNMCWPTGAISIKCFYLSPDYSRTVVIAGANMSITTSHPS